MLGIGTSEWKEMCHGKAAISDLNRLFENISKLKGDKNQYPKINCQIFSTKEFSLCSLNKEIQSDRYPKPKSTYKFDTLIDVSLLQRRV